MDDTLTPLILDFLEWLARRPRSYTEVMETWRTSCPRLPVWEEATDNGFVTRRHKGGQASLVELTERGEAFLVLHRSISIRREPGERELTERTLHPSAS